jgi:cysteine dioxygenase
MLDQPLKNQNLSRGELKEGQVAYINDLIGLHRLENPSHTETAITLHLYIPSYNHCNTFDGRTSCVNESNVTFYSISGQLTINE